MSTETNTDDQEQRTDNQMTRRELMRRGATAGAGAVTLHAADDLSLDLNPVGEAEAGAPIVAAVIVGGIVTHAANNAFKNGNDAEEAAKQTQIEQLQEQYYQAALSTQKYNQRAILSQDALISEGGLNALNGLEQMAYEEGTARAIESMNQGMTQANTLANAKTEAKSVLTPVQKTIINEYEVAVTEYNNYKKQIEDVGSSSDVTDVVTQDQEGLAEVYTSDESNSKISDVTYLNGDTESIKHTQWGPTDGYYRAIAPHDGSWGLNAGSGDSFESAMYVSHMDSDLIYLSETDWPRVWQKTVDAWNSVEAELEKFVNDTYSAWQSGEISKDQMMTSRMLAKRAAEDSDTPRAISDLIAMGVETSLDRQVAITTSRNGVQWTYAGWIAATKAPSGGLQVGSSYQPNSTNDNGDLVVGSVYIVTKPEDVVGSWPSSGYQNGVDGGIITLTKEPLANPTDGAGYVYVVETTAGETVNIATSDWTQNDSGNWELDATDRLETQITEVASIKLKLPDSVQQEYFQQAIESEFTVEEVINEATGENFEKVEIEQQTASAPTDYRTPDDFKQQRKRNEELYRRMLERMKELEDDGNGGGGWGLPGTEKAKAAFLAIVGIFGGIAALNAASG